VFAAGAFQHGIGLVTIRERLPLCVEVELLLAHTKGQVRQVHKASTHVALLNDAVRVFA
jgi:hypothetical protein